VEERIGQDVNGKGKMLPQHFGVEAGALAAGEGVKCPADGIDRLGDLLRASPLRPLEQHVLDEVRDAGHLRRLVP